MVGCSDLISVALNPASTLVFDPLDYGYTQPAAKTVYVSNTGNQATGALSIVLSNPTDFAIDRESVANIAKDGEAQFTVQPKSGLAAGKHEATVTVSGSNISGKSITVTFTVNAPSYNVQVLPASAINFEARYDNGYTPPTAQTVTVNNLGYKVDTLTVALSGTNAGDFVLDKTTTLASLANSSTTTFTVQPKASLAANTYSATITVSGWGDSKTIPVNFTVNHATYSIQLDKAALAFGEALFGYAPVTAQTVSVSNKGNQPTGALDIVFSGSNPDAFVAAPATITTIAVSDDKSFSVNPKTGLAVGNYSATVRVSGGNGISASFDVSFTVNPNSGVTVQLWDDLQDTAILDGGTINWTKAQAATETISVKGAYTGIKWTVNANHQTGFDNETSFNLKGYAPGQYTINVIVQTGGQPYSASVTVKITE